jgi:gliding motility-associated-like protein
MIPLHTLLEQMTKRLDFCLLLLASFVFTNQLHAEKFLKLHKNFSESLVSQAASSQANKNPNDLCLKAQGNLGFLENKGQMRDMNDQPVPHVLFKAEAAELNLWITENGVTFQTFRQEKQLVPEEELSALDKRTATIKRKPKKNKLLHWERIDVELVGASIKKENISKEEPQQGSQNHYQGNEAPVLDVKHYKKITIKDVYPGIDWVWYFDGERKYKYDFIVHPGADYRQIKLRYISKTPININASGELELYTEHGNIKELKPISFLAEHEFKTQFNQFTKKQIQFHGDSGYETTIGFDFPETNRHIFDELLVIDPEIFWSTLYGGNNWDGPTCLAIDNDNNIFMGGYSYSSNFPTLSNGTFFQGTNFTTNTGFIVKFTETGSLIWSTYIGGNAGEELYSIDIDSENNIYAGGSTGSINFPLVSPGGGTFFQGSSVDGSGFIAKFSNTGALLWSTFFPFVKSVAVDLNDNLFVCSEVYNNSFPVTNPGGGAYIQNYSPLEANDLTETYLAKFSNTGVLQWSTYFGGNDFDIASSIRTDNLGNLYFTGSTFSPDIPLLNPGSGAFFQTPVNPNFGNAFLAKFTNFGVLQWSTCFGGEDTDLGKSLAIDDANNVFWAGETYSTDITCVNPGGGAFFQNFNAGLIDAFVCKFSSTGNLIWSTYYGTPSEDVIQNSQHLSIDNCGRVYFSFDTGFLTNATFAPCEGGFVASGTGLISPYLSRFSNSGQLQWATYIGGEGFDFRCPITNDCKGNLIIAGEWGYTTTTTSYPLVNPGNGAFFVNNFNVPNGADEDGYIIKFDMGLPVACNLEYNLCPNNPIEPIIEILENVLTIGVAQGLPPGIVVAFDNEELVFSGTPTQIGEFNFSIPLFTDICGCEDNLIYEGTFIIAVPQNINIIGDLGVCAGNTTDLTAGGLIAGYQWSTGEQTQSITVGPGTFWLTSSDPNACFSSDTVSVFEFPNPVVSISGNTSVCEGNETILEANSGFITYQWTNGSNEATAILGVGTYSLTVTDSLGCQATAEITVISSSPTAGISLSSNVIITDDQLILQNTSAAGLFPINSWNWSFGDGNTSNIENPNHSYSDVGNYVVTLVVTDELGCTDTAFVEILVVGPIIIPNVVTPNNDNANDLLLIQNLDITLPSKLVVINRWGNIVFEIENYQNDWSPTTLIDSVYFYQFDYLNRNYQGFFHVFRGD